MHLSIASSNFSASINQTPMRCLESTLPLLHLFYRVRVVGLKLNSQPFRRHEIMDFQPLSHPTTPHIYQLLIPSCRVHMYICLLVDKTPVNPNGSELAKLREMTAHRIRVSYHLNPDFFWFWSNPGPIPRWKKRLELVVWLANEL